MMLKDRVALVIGAGAGLGRAIARAYAREGAIVAAADLNLAASEETLQICGQTGRGIALATDVADAAASADAVRRVCEAFGRIDILCNCAAVCLVDPILEVTPDRWDKVFAVNSRGAFFAIQAAGRAMAPNGYGRILTITTPASRLGFPNFASYAASKASVDSMTRAFAIALAPDGVTVNTLVPGRMTGGMIDALEVDLQRITGKSTEQLREERTKGLPMQRRVAPEEVAEAAVWLASEAAGYVTAERFNFTGGMELS